MSKKKAHAISNGIFLISLGILIFTNAWWPGILLALWASIATRQFLTGRVYYAMLTSFILLGLFFVTLFKFHDYLAPVILVIGGIFLIVKEYFFEDTAYGEDKSQQLLEDAEIDESE